MASSIRRDISEKGFLEILEKDFFVVPSYQRNYSWDEYNHNALWDDIIAARTKRIASNNTGVGNHFMSSILIKDGEDGLKYIVDGQQRLITITLFLHAARSLIEDDGDYLYESIDECLYGNRREEDYLTGRKIKVKAPRILLKNQPENNAYDALVKGEEWKFAHKSSKIYKAYEFFRKRLKDIQDQQDSLFNNNLFSETVMTVLENLRIIYIPILANESPQKIFESVNGLTKELFAGELIKNYLLMSTISEASTDEIYNKFWSKFDNPEWSGDDKSKEEFTKLLYYWVGSKGLILKSDNESVYRAFKAYAKLSSIHDGNLRKDRVYQISQDINHSLSVYESLSEGKFNPTDRLGVFYTRLFSGKQAYNAKSVLMLYINLIKTIENKYDINLSDNEVDLLVSPAESYIVRRIFSPKGFSNSSTKAVIDSIYNILPDINSQSDSSKIFCNEFSKRLSESLLSYKTLSNKWFTNEEIIDFICGNSDKGIMPMSITKIFHQQARMIITQYENYKQIQNPFTAKALSFGEKEYTLEHWMPQNVKDGDWEILDRSLRSIYTASFGNMAVIPQSINSKLSNHSLDKKIAIVKEHLQKSGEASTGLKTLDWIIDKCNSEDRIQWNEKMMYEYSYMIIDTAFTKIFKENK